MERKLGKDFYDLYCKVSRPSKYKLYDFYREDGLIDGCKFILVFEKHHTWNGYESVPVRSITEAVRFLREAK